MAYKLHPNLNFIELSEDKKKCIITFFKEIELSKALYEIISFGDPDIMDEFIANNPKAIPSVSHGFSNDKSEINISANNINQLLLNAYYKLYLKRVIIDDDMKRYLYEKSIKTSYSDEGQTGDMFSDELLDSKGEFERIKKEASERINKEAFERIKKEVCEMIEELCRISDDQERRNSFVFICLYLASRVNSLKKLFKLNRFETDKVYRVFPLEQIQFILSIYAYSYQNISKEGASLYLCVLTENTLMQHLKKFQCHLERFEINDGSMTEPIESSGKEKTKKKRKYNNKKKDTNINVKNGSDVKTESEIQGPAANKNSIPNTENTIADKDETYDEQSKNSNNDYIANNYPNLNRDFWLVKNIYSLKIINEHIDVILQIKYLDSYSDQSLQEEKEICEIEFLAMERCLVVIGEFTKNSAESPHLSQDIKDEICILTGNNVQVLLKKIRNDLSHFTDLKFGQNWHPSLGLSQSFKHIQLDFQKINDSFKFLLGREKYAAVECFAKKLIDCKTVENMHLIYPNFVLDAIIIETGRLSENYKNVSLRFFETALQNLKEVAKQSDKANMREIELIDNLSKSIDCWAFNKDNRPIKNGYILIGLAAHLRYFQFVKIKHNKNLNYNLFVEILDALLSNIKMKSTLNCEEQYLFEENIYNLIQITENPEIKNEACKLARLICKDMKSVEGIKSFKQNYNSSIHTLKKTFFQCKSEVDDIFRFIREQLTLEADILKFEEKVKKEVNEYNRINEIFDIIYNLKNIKEPIDRTLYVKEQIDQAKYLISKKDSQFPTDSQLIKDMIDILSKEKIDYNLCLDKAKRIYKGKKKCNYENLVREFMNKDNYSVISKAKLISEFFSGRMEGAESQLNTKSIQKIVEEGYLLVFNNKFNILKKICARLDDYVAGCDTESGIEFNYKPKLTLAAEMVLHQVLELAHKYGGGDNNIALLTLRPDVLVHCGKSLRNFLAHQDIFYKLFSFETDLVLLRIAEEMSTKQPTSWIPRHNYLMRNELNYFDWCAEKLYFGETSFDVIRLQEIMFKAVEDDDKIKLEECIASGADPRGTNVYKRNALQLAFDCCSVGCFQLLVDRCYKIIICEPQMRKSNTALTLNIHDLSDLIKLIKIILKLPSIKNKLKDLETVTNKVMYLSTFINEKFISHKENIYDKNKPLGEFCIYHTINYIHLLVYFQAVREINELFQLGVQMQSELDIKGNSAVHWAAALGFDDICQILLDNNFGLNEENKNGHSPLDIAIVEGKWKTVKFLISRKAVKYNPHIDPLLLAIMMEENICSELWESAPFIEIDNSLNIFLFSYALSYSDKVMIDKLLNYLNSLTTIKAVTFFESSNHSLDLNILKKVTHNVILSLACFFGRKNIVCSMLKKANFEEITEKFKYTPEEMVYLNNVSFINQLFKVESLLSWTCLGNSKENGEIAKFLLSKGYDPDTRDVNGFSSFHTALLQGTSQVCEVLIDKGANIELFSPTGLLPIHISSMYGFIEIIKVLLDKKVTLSVLTKQSLRSPLHLAALGGHNEVIKMLLDYNKTLVAKKYKCIIDLGDLNGFTALHLALLQRQREAAKILLEHGADILKKSYNKMSSIHAAAACSGQEDILKLIISKIPEENRKELVNSFTEIINEKYFFKAANISNSVSESDFQRERGRIIMETPLFYAESEKAVRILLENGANINLKNSLGRTALHEAIHKGNTSVVKILTENSCNADTVDCRGFTPLASAVYLGQVNIVILLLKKNVNINFCIQESFSTLFIAFKNKLDLVELVLNKKGNINNNINKSLFWLLVNCKNGITPIMISASKGFTGLTKILLENKAEINKSVWQNPLTVAIGNGHSEAAQVLLEAFSLEDVSNSNLPYLHFAIAVNDSEIVKLLLSKGVSPLIEFEDSSAIKFAAQLKHFACYGVLAKHKHILEDPIRHIYFWRGCKNESEPKVFKLKDEHNITIIPQSQNYITYYQPLTSIIIRHQNLPR